MGIPVIVVSPPFCFCIQRSHLFIILRHLLKPRHSALSLPAEERYVWSGYTKWTLIKDQVFAAGSEDMDTLTFATPVLFRHLTFSEAKKAPISEIVLEKALQGLDLSMTQVSDK